MHIGLIADTNYNESAEFLSSYFDFKFAMIMLGIAVLIIGVYQLMRRVNSIRLRILLSGISICSIILSTCFGVWRACGTGLVLDSIMKFHEISDYVFSDSLADFEVRKTSSLHPDIILVIGESFDKKHSSLYKYDKDTNPLLAKRQRDTSLIVFQSVKSPAPNTRLSIRQMLSLSERYDDDLWYEKPILITALKKGGYRTCWISNQSMKSVYDNSLRDLAQLSDSVIYTCDYYGNEYLSRKTTFDEVLFSPLEDYMTERGEQERKFCVLKLMGSHCRFDLRYPVEYAKFVADDYLKQPE